LFKKKNYDIQLHRCTQVGEWGKPGVNIGTQANFKTLVNKNAKKSEIVGPPSNFLLKALTP
jgi:hypothetical protein